ncbi:apoptosis facilitator Bcl-2-like protein 14 [Austrofundulus limnaeus]|uniref:Apoptosis facilitator Bcl-2-like protein 14 n=1 Tax=Austrofundulus limnaeus TaxID=52670 RepID=A0A2I4CQG5_AUSLI|nr:PREDICTED: apoptosis facilitator Bcl-2-like protein 14 [Austrofundulus limnaeus]
MEGPQGTSEVLQLLQDYCTKRSRQNWSRTTEQTVLKFLGASGLESDSSSPPPPPVVLQIKNIPVAVSEVLRKKQTPSLDEDFSGLPVFEGVQSPAPPQRGVAERLVEITESAQIRKEDVQTQEELIQKLVQLIVAFGDDINSKLKQNPVLEQQLQNLSYGTFEKLMSTVQSLVVPVSRAAGPDGRVEQQKIAWAFEVTSRLSAVGVVQHRRVLNFGAQYIEQNHAGWVQQHGGWEEAFD